MRRVDVPEHLDPFVSIAFAQWKWYLGVGHFIHKVGLLEDLRQSILLGAVEAYSRGYDPAQYRAIANTVQRNIYSFLCSIGLRKDKKTKKFQRKEQGLMSLQIRRKRRKRI